MRSNAKAGKKEETMNDLGSKKKSLVAVDQRWQESHPVPKKLESSIGPEHQVSYIPAAGSYLCEGNESSEK